MNFQTDLFGEPVAILVKPPTPVALKPQQGFLFDPTRQGEALEIEAEAQYGLALD